MERKDHLDFVTAIIVGAIGIYSFADSFAINTQYYARPQHSDYLTSPALMPAILGIALILCAVILMLRTLRRAPIGAILPELRQSVISFVKSDLVHRTVIGLLVMGAYVFFLLKNLPFLVASLIFLIVIMLLLRSAKLWKILLISVVTVFAVVLLFQGVFHVRLP